MTLLLLSAVDHLRILLVTMITIGGVEMIMTDGVEMTMIDGSLLEMATDECRLLQVVSVQKSHTQQLLDAFLVLQRGKS